MSKFKKKNSEVLATNKCEKEHKRKKRTLILVTFISGLLFAMAAWAWFSQTLNVRIDFFQMRVDSDTGLYISLDGIDFSEEILISRESILNDLTPRYPNHTNRWSITGLRPVSSNGLPNPNTDRFDIFWGEVHRRRSAHRDDDPQRRLFAVREVEDAPTPVSRFVAFDFFLRNITHSPHPDNLFIENDSVIDFSMDEIIDPEVRANMAGIVNSMRFGLVFKGTVPIGSDIETIQNMRCEQDCHYVIWEPNDLRHSPESIARAATKGITVVDGQPHPTFAVIAPGGPINHRSGQPGSGVPLDPNHFALQRTHTNLNDAIWEIPHGITKVRAYLWVEGQDIDGLETDEAITVLLDVLISLSKDLAGYEY